MKKILLIITTIILTFIFLVASVIGGAFIFAQYENQQFITDNITTQKETTISLDLNDYPELPEPVEAYFNYTFNGKKSITVSTVHWRENGEFMLPVGTFTTDASQTSVATKPIYLWQGVYNNSIPMLDSRDGFAIDSHNMRAKLFGLMPVMQTDYTEQDEITELHSYLMLRYYGTAPDFPWTLLPSEYIEWTAKDSTHAYLNISYTDYHGTYLVTFNSKHQVIQMESEEVMLHGNNDKLREVGAKSNYQAVNGFMIPTHMEYKWYDRQDQLNSWYTFDISDVIYE